MDQVSTYRGAISLRDTFADAQVFGAHDIHATSCCSDATCCRAGDVFVALTRAQFDGHDQVEHAIEQGASAIVAERFLPVDVPVCVVDDSREAYGQLCQRLVGNPSDDLNVIGITGTCGKSSTAILVRSILKAADRCAGLACSLENHDSLESAAGLGESTTSPQLATWLAKMCAAGCSDGILELSSQTLAQRCHTGIDVDLAVFTNLKRDHLDFHGSVKNYHRAKKRLLASLRKGGAAILNADDPGSQELIAQADVPMLTYGLRTSADLTATLLERHRSEQTFLLCCNHESVPVRTQTIGDGHISNCLAAAATCIALGVDLITVARGLEAVSCIEGRLERIECGQPFSVFVDACRSSTTLSATLQTLRQVTTGRLFCVFGAAADADPQTRPLLGRAAERGAHQTIITSDNPGHEQPLQIVHDILDGYNRPGHAQVIPDRRRAIQWALQQARHGDTVLIAGKGSENHQRIGAVLTPFDDRSVARSWLYEAAEAVPDLPETQPRLRVVRHLT